uniref:Uncharacterized protein n=1 Tax=Romanomermis culicivorax TaxID=13658 RepID=A0A915K084_ROMCU
MVPLPSQYQVPQFPIMQFQPGQAPYYHQFLVLPGLQMPPPSIIWPVRNAQGKEQMDILGSSTVAQPPQRPPSTESSPLIGFCRPILRIRCFVDICGDSERGLVDFATCVYSVLLFLVA